MKRNILLVMSITLLAGLPLLASAHPLPSLTITTAQEGNKVAFQSVRLEHDRTGHHIIKGQLRRIGREPVHFGHIDYTVTDVKGKVLETGQTNYTSAIKLRHMQHPSYLTVAPKVALTSDSHINLAWTPDPLRNRCVGQYH
jgi:hypothetical protein